MIKLSTGTAEGLQKILPSEKTGIAAELIRIQEEYTAIMEAALAAGLSGTAEYDAYEQAYAALYHYLQDDPGVLLVMDAVSYVDPVEHQAVFNDYYGGKSRLSYITVPPPSNQVSGASLVWSDNGEKEIAVHIEFGYAHGVIPATHFLLFQNTDITVPAVIDPDTVSQTRTVRAGGNSETYAFDFTVPQVSGTVQLHYRFAISAACLGAAGFNLAGAPADGGEGWHDITVIQTPAELVCSGDLHVGGDLSVSGKITSYDLITAEKGIQVDGELRAGTADRYIRLNTATNTLEHPGVRIDTLPPLHYVHLWLPDEDGEFAGQFNAVKAPWNIWTQLPENCWKKRFSDDGVYFQTEGTASTAGQLARDGRGIQDDAIRNITGSVRTSAAGIFYPAGGVNGAFRNATTWSGAVSTGQGANGAYSADLDVSLVVPTDIRNHPRNVLVRLYELISIPEGI